MANNIIDIVKYEGDNSVLIFKCPITDFNIGTQLIVHENQEAVFFKDGKALESFGPGRHTLETNNVPVVRSLMKKVSGGNVFHTEVYFINLATELGVKWGTDSKIRMFDPVSGLHIELGASGTFNLHVIDGRKLLTKVVGTTSTFVQKQIFGSVGYPTNETVGVFRGMIVSKVKTSLARAIRENDINILEVDEYFEELSEILKNKINEVLFEYGLEMPEFFITNIATPDDDPNFKRLKEQHAARYLKVQEERIRKAQLEAAREADIVEAETQAKVKVISAEAEAKAHVLEAEAKAKEMELQGYTYSEETVRVIGKAAAENESGGANGIASDVVKAGVGIGVGVSVAEKVIDSVKPVLSEDNTWECSNCHHKGNKGKFCEECGSAKVQQNVSWDCPVCGQKGNTGNFCGNCGNKK